jgi:GNAT superfamily N-acetyltransferase
MNQFENHQIVNTEDPYFGAFWSIYNESFPLNERRTSDQQIAIFKKAGYRIDLYLSGTQVIGFIASWEAKEFVFIEHFAIAPEFRSKGLGSAILNPFILSKTNLVILEIDPPVDELTSRRLRFYSLLGFLKNDFPHIQPSYRPGELPLQLTLLSWPDLISNETYSQFSKFQNDTVMG